MDYQQILDSILEIRDDIYKDLENDQLFKVKKKLDQIRELADGIIEEDDQQKIIDKISVYEFLADLYNECGRLKISTDCYGKCIDLSKKIIDENREEYDPIRDYYRHYIANRYLLEGNTSEDLEEELYEYLDEDGLNLRETTIEYYSTALKHDPIEDSEEYLAVIDEVDEKLYDALNTSRADDDYLERYRLLKKKILHDDYGIDWKDPFEYNEE